MSALPLPQVDASPSQAGEGAAVPRFDRHILPTRISEAIWLGTELGSADSRTIKTGFELLDSELPGGGWGTHSLIEILLSQPSMCEWRLLSPCLAAAARDGGQIYLISPPKRPNIGGLAQLGIPFSQLVWIDAKGQAERLWAAEQLIKSDPHGAVVAWLPQARPEQIRRLQVHAGSCDAPAFLLRPITAERDASAAPLRVSVSLGDSWNLNVQILKRRGRHFDGVLQLPAIPGSLAKVLPPRLSTFSAQPSPIRQEATDARALGRTAANSARTLTVPH